MEKKTFCTLLIATLLLSSCGNNQEMPVETTAAETATISAEKTETTTSSVQNIGEPKTVLISNYCKFESANIPNIPENERGIKAQGAENVILDTKQTEDLMLLLIGNFVSNDNENYPGMVNCFDFGVALSDETNVGDVYGAPSEFIGGIQGGYWLYEEKLSDYISVHKFKEYYIIVFRYYDFDNNSLATFYAIKDGVIYPMLMGDYSESGVEQLAVVTELSENIAIDEDNFAIKDIDNGRLYIFDFDMIGETFKGAHYAVVNATADNDI